LLIFIILIILIEIIHYFNIAFFVKISIIKGDFMNVLIINAHPDLGSFTSKISNKLHKKHNLLGNTSKQLNLAELDFPISFKGFGDIEELPADLVKAQELIKWSEHIVITSPIWWSTYPALLKGFFDRTLLPNFAFQYVKGKAVPKKLLTGRTAELFLLSDAPAWYRKYLLRDPAATVLKRDILGFCGIKVKKVSRIGNVRSLSAPKREEIISKL
jgi:putative NADPH-quinone reductase